MISRVDIQPLSIAKIKIFHQQPWVLQTDTSVSMSTLRDGDQFPKTLTSFTTSCCVRNTSSLLLFNVYNEMQSLTRFIQFPDDVANHKEGQLFC